MASLFRGLFRERAISSRLSRGLPAIPSLTGVRGIAAIWVMLFHVQAFSLALGPQWLQKLPFVDAGWSGVDMFFVLSGFVLMRTHRDDFFRVEARNVLRFMKLRVSRVYPLSTTVLFLVAWLAVDTGFVSWYRLDEPGNFTPLAFVKTLLLATRWCIPGRGNWNEPIWSLSAELLGYAIFPILAWALIRVRTVSMALAAGFISLGLLLAFQLVDKHGVGNYIGQIPSVIRMACCFIAGAAFCRASLLAPRIFLRHASTLSMVALGLIAAAALAPAIAGMLPFGYAVLIFALSFGRGPIDRMLSLPISLFLGKISFPLYLLHVMPLLWLSYHLRTAGVSQGLSLVALLLCAAGCIGLAFLLHRLVEVPSQRWGRQWALASPPAVATGSSSGVSARG